MTAVGTCLTAAPLTIVLLAAAGLMGAGVGAGEVSGATLKQRGLVSPVELKQCKRIAAAGSRHRWSCRGLPGYPIHIGLADQRSFISIGPEAEKQRAAEQTLAAPNTIFKDATSRAILEWRTSGGGAKATPRAVIVHFFTRHGEREGEVLAVLKVSPRETCHAAYIDRLANADAITLARRFADEEAPRFDCNRAPVIVGTRGMSPM